MLNKLFTVCVVSVILFSSCKQNSSAWKEKATKPEIMHSCIDQLTLVIVYDVFSPPVASRVYVYPNIAAYEAMVPSDKSAVTLAGKLNGLKPLPQPDKDKQYCFEIAATTAFIETAKKIIFSEEKMNVFKDSLYNYYKTSGVPEDVFANSVKYGEAVAKHIIAWSSKDNYKESRSFERYTPMRADSAWVPTPPDYMDALEPNWNKIRPLVMDSASQFEPAKPYLFSTNKNSDFYKQAYHVYEIVNNLTQEQTHIARFWDNNPYINEHHGHLMVGIKKVSPGGHWLGISGMASRTTNADFLQSVEAYTFTSIALFEGFISCWDEKYRCHYIRPETYINRYIDSKWKPLIQTPPFPEYTSGHSVITATSATVLTELYGESFAFTDSVEVPFGQKPRKFNSFLDAAQEASISRLYGGIHFLPSLNNGNLQGRTMGQYIINKLGIRPFTFKKSEQK